MSARTPVTWILLGLAVGLAMAACGEQQAATSATATKAPKVDADKPAAPHEVLATVGEVDITVGQLQERLAAETPYVRTRYTSVDQKREFLHAMVRFEILAQEALARGLASHPDVVLATKKVLAQVFVRSKFDAEVSPEAVTDEAITAYYQANLARFVTTEEVRASGLMLKTKAVADRAAATARAPAHASNEGFAKLVDDLTLDTLTKPRRGDLRYFTRADTALPAPLVAAAFALGAVGDISDPVAADNGAYWVLRLTDRRPARQRTLAEVKQEIRYLIYDQQRQAAREALVAELRKAATIEVNQAALDAVTRPPAVANEAAPAPPTP